MRVLYRRSTEAIVLDDEITIRIVGINGHTVRIGVEAPKTVLVLRNELLQADKDETPPEKPPIL